MEADNISIEMVEEFKYLGTALADKISIKEEIKSRLKLGNACYHSVQNLLYCTLLSKNLKIKLYKGKAIPLRAWTGPEGSRRLRLPEFKTIGT
jgi:hypothetical protein